MQLALSPGPSGVAALQPGGQGVSKAVQEWVKVLIHEHDFLGVVQKQSYASQQFCGGPGNFALQLNFPGWLILVEFTRDQDTAKPTGILSGDDGVEFCRWLVFFRI
jgi:hypothetical protein